jgi:hypothetical protein
MPASGKRLGRRQARGAGAKGIKKKMTPQLQDRIETETRSCAMHMRDLVAVLIAALVIGLVFFATVRFEHPKVSVEQTK